MQVFNRLEYVAKEIEVSFPQIRSLHAHKLEIYLRFRTVISCGILNSPIELVAMIQCC